MRTFLIFVAASVLGSLVGSLVLSQIGIALKADAELILGFMLLSLLTITTSVVFGIVYASGGSVKAIDRAALALVGVVVLLAAGIIATGIIDSKAFLISAKDWAVLAENTLPNLIMIAIQWFIIRRRKKSRG